MIDDTLSKSSITPLKYLPDSTLRIETPKKVPYIFHSPYESKLCEGCHIAGSPGDLTDPEDELCLKCHTPYQDSFEYVHGPADAGLCMTCHDPHMSKREFLLIREEDEICTVCHYPGAIHKVMESIPAKDKHCTECHDPHGGKEKMFLIKSDKK